MIGGAVAALAIGVVVLWRRVRRVEVAVTAARGRGTAFRAAAEMVAWREGEIVARGTVPVTAESLPPMRARAVDEDEVNPVLRR